LGYNLSAKDPSDTTLLRVTLIKIVFLFFDGQQSDQPVDQLLRCLNIAHGVSLLRCGAQVNGRYRVRRSFRRAR
jgi:hypothetical protein